MFHEPSRLLGESLWGTLGIFLGDSQQNNPTLKCRSKCNKQTFDSILLQISVVKGQRRTSILKEEHAFNST